MKIIDKYNEEFNSLKSNQVKAVIELICEVFEIQNLFDEKDEYGISHYEQLLSGCDDFNNLDCAAQLIYLTLKKAREQYDRHN